MTSGLMTAREFGEAWGEVVSYFRRKHRQAERKVEKKKQKLIRMSLL